jgi:prevent-host-death family protein
MKIPAGQFKAECLKLMDQVAENHTEIIITKRGKPVARLVAAYPDKNLKSSGVCGWMKGTVEILGDIVSPLDEKWSANE